MDILEETALIIRLEAVEAEHMINLTGLAMIVCPPRWLRLVSEERARLRIEEERDELIRLASTRPAPIKQVVSIAELAAA